MKLTAVDVRRRLVVAYGFAVAAVAVVAVVRRVLEPVLGDVAPLILFLISVAAAAWFGGFGPGLAATVLGLVVGLTLFAAGPRPSILTRHGAGYYLVRGVPFVLVGGAISGIAAQLEAARARAQRQAERAGRAEDLLRRTFESVTDFSIFTTDLAGRVTSWNAGAERVFGYAEDDAIGMPAETLFTPEDRADGAPARELGRAAAAGRAGDERWHLRRDGSRFFASGIVTPLRDVAGVVVGFTKVARDVTEQHTTRQAMAESRRRSEAALLAADTGTFEWDVTADRVYGDANFGRIFEVDRGPDGDVSLAAYTAAIHPDDRDRVGRQIATSVATGADFESEYRVLAGGRERWVLARGRMDVDPATGRVVRFPGVVIDVTDRKRAAADLRASEGRFRDLFTRMDEGYCVIEVLYEPDPATGVDRPVDYRFELVNPAFVTHTGLADPVGRTMRELASGHESHWAEAYGRVAETGVPERFTQEAAALGAHFEVYAFRVGEPGDRRVAVLFSNVTERRQAERDREAALANERQLRSVAEQASRMKDDFLATISHELRTPLNAIVGWAQLMGDPTVDAETVREGLEVIGRNAALQNRLIEDILDVSRITAGKLRLAAVPVDVRSPLAAAVETVRTGAAAKRIALDVDDGGAAVEVMADADRLQQVFWNLMANAIKFSDRGGRVTVAVRRAGPKVTVTVADQGQGMAAEFLPYVFDRFRQADMSTTRRAGGLGLGLSIVRQLVELHGGTVSADSPGEGRGSTFAVELPAATAAVPSTASGPTPAAAPVRLDGVRVLALDDEPDARRVVQATLARVGAEVTLVGSVADAVGVLAGDEPFDVVLSDIGMPGEDGYAFIRRLRHLERHRPAADRPPVPAVALTALTRPSDRTGVLVAGFDRYLPKPVQPAELLRVVADLLGRGSSATPPTIGPASNAVSR